MMKFSERIKTARKYSGMSQAQLSEQVGITQSAISQLENTESDRSEYTAQIAHYCGVSAIWLAAEEGPMITHYSTDHRAQHVLQVFEALPEAFKDEAVKSVDSLTELAERLKHKSA
jgi:transcriptional regulator with XRE-family HTH domain